MNARQNETLANLALEYGVSLQKEQCLLIRTGLGSYHFAQTMADLAYRRGARFVRIEIMDNRLLRSRLLHSSWENLSYFPQDIVAKARVEVDETWARIRIENTEEIQTLAGLESERYSEVLRTANSQLAFLKDDVMNHRHPWLVMTYPGPGWASLVYQLPETASESEKQQAYAKFEQEYAKILRLNSPDPLETWRGLGKTLHERSAAFDELGLDRLVFQTGDSELTVGLHPRHRWSGGPATLPDGRMHEPNLPTEEIFTAPDYRRTEGFVRATRPVNFDGVSVVGAWFRFKKGAVVDCGAEEGEEFLKEYLNFDEQARYLGEVALVDLGNPIYQSGLTFQTTIFDENAACHIAFGAAYPTCIEGGRYIQDPAELLELGCNVSLIHKDFMISSEETNVTGYTAGGREIALIRAGVFVL